MKITLNGRLTEVPDAATVAELLAFLGIPSETALVELNQVALFRGDWPQSRLAEGDCVEILRVAAGG